MKPLSLLITAVILATVGYADWYEDTIFSSTDGLIYAYIQDNISVESVHAERSYGTAKVKNL